VAVDLVDLASEIGAITEPLISSKGLRFQLDIGADVTSISTDPRKLRQILINLVGNAIKFTRHGEIRLRVWREEDQMIGFEIRDTWGRHRVRASGNDF
jgi:signal transduction histidine kinase